jgi:hypothetical protein
MLIVQISLVIKLVLTQHAQILVIMLVIIQQMLMRQISSQAGSSATTAYNSNFFQPFQGATTANNANFFELCWCKVQ